ncbi:putative Ig domain-containing protein [Geothrix sp. PMB-07]|uniref:beta strand repeat-containing protein n=1 Tax=Geothrix sp. PMB-07 TaxID=3068640 RepID=UPI0027417C02|nr:putative Ig domain-containing protein [Geothrix sp. PMB-07]WLT32567.1 putative Ig domain-containing protein [Geothrix sp. PMB-07]
MRPQIYLPLALALTALAMGPVACTSSTWCVDCDHAVAILGLNYQPSNTYTVGTPIAVNPPNPFGGTPKTYDIASGTLPAGLSLDPATGQITGTPTATGVYTVTLRGTNSANSATQTIQITVLPSAALGLSYATPQVFPAAQPIAAQNPVLTQATPGIPTTYAVVNGWLPAGLTLGADGIITGTPTTPGVYPLTVTATNGTRTASASVSYTVTPAGSLGLSYVTPKTFTAGAAIATQAGTLVNAVPGLASTFAITGGSLPTGLSLSSSTGEITGTPTAPGVYAFTIGATQGARSASASASYTVLPAASLSLGYTTPQTFVVGTTIATQLPTLASDTPGVSTTYALTSGALPAGLTLNADGTITGKPTTTGVSTFTVTATNGTRTATATPTYTVIAPTPQAAYQSVTTNVNLPLTLTPQNAGGPVTAATLASGPLPTGMTLNANGSLSGTPTTTGAFPFTVQLCNGAGCTTTGTAVITVNANGVPPLKASYLDGNGLVATPLSVPPTVTIGGPITAATLQSGTLPAGMTLDSQGNIAGTPTTAGSSLLLVTLANAAGALETVPVTITISASASTLAATYPTSSGQVGTPLAVEPTVTSGGPVVSAAQLGGTLPPGMTLDSRGRIIGTPTQAGSYSAQIRLCNASGGCTTQTAQIDVNTAAASGLVAAYADAAGTLGNPLAVPPSITSGGPVTTATLLSGSLPPGMTLNPNGSITGTPTQRGTYNLTIQLCNGAGGCTVQSVTLTVTDPAPAVSPLSITETLGATNTLTPANTGGPITSASITAGGPLPSGLTLNANGTISQAGTTPIGTYGPYTVNYCNSGGCLPSTVTIVVNLTAPTALHYATPTTYTTTVAITDNQPNPTGGTPSTYAVTAGTLPAGLTLNTSTGVISGTPTAATAGAVSVTIRGSNGAGGVNQVLSITVLAYPTANLSSNPSTVPVDQSSSLTVLFTGSADGKAVLTGDGIATPLSITSGTSVPTGVVSAAGTTRNYLLTVTSPQGYVATSATSVQWVAVPSDTWTVTIPQGGGGPLTPGGGSLLNGQISITVPDQGQAICGNVVLTVNKEASLPGAIVASARDYSHTFNIASNLGYPFRVPITITLAYDPTLASPNLASTDLPMAFYWDPSYSKWVSTGVKSVDTTNHKVTFTTLLPGRYAVLGIPGLSPANQSLGFTSGVDDWRQNNPAVYDLPGGASLGMGSFASWFLPFMKAGNGGTGLYNQFPTISDANAAALISRLANGTMDSWNALWQQSAYTLTTKQTELALLTGLMVTGQSQILLMADGHPAVNTALATAVYGFNSSTNKFNVMDPNYPGNALTITWDPTLNSGVGDFTAYDRAAGYSPALTTYAFEGQTSVHRLADYDRVFSGAASSFPAATFASIDISNIAGASNPDLTQDVVVSSNLNVTVSGTVTNGDETATHIYWSQNGSAPRVAVPLTGNAFTFTIPALADPYGTTIALETTSTPCDPTFSHSGFKKFVLKQSGLSPWFPNMCFESGNTTPWILQQSSNSGLVYPTDAPAALQANATPSWNAQGEISNYAVTGTWSAGSADSAIVTPGNDARVSSLPMVLDGGYAFRVNDPASGSHISRLYQDITVPATVARPKLGFYWAAVLEDNGHPASQQPYVEVLVQDLDSIVNGHPENLFYKYFYANDTKYVGWVKGTGLWWGIPWQKVNLNLGSGRAGHHLRVRVTAADCTNGGHGGVAYIDSASCN